jgi:hypothetical protein
MATFARKVLARGEAHVTTVVLVGTLDTKGREYLWLRDRLGELGAEVVLVDAGTGEPQAPADVTNHDVARAAGADLAALRAAGDRGAAVPAMGEGAAVVLAEPRGWWASSAPRRWSGSRPSGRSPSRSPPSSPSRSDKEITMHISPEKVTTMSFDWG